METEPILAFTPKRNNCMKNKRNIDAKIHSNANTKSISRKPNERIEIMNRIQFFLRHILLFQLPLLFCSFMHQKCVFFHYFVCLFLLLYVDRSCLVLNLLCLLLCVLLFFGVSILLFVNVFGRKINQTMCIA